MVGDAGDGEEAVRKALALRPDLVLMDVYMPGLDGLQATAVLRKEAPAIKVLALSVELSCELVTRVVRAGAHGYLSKNASTDELAGAIMAVHTGTRFFAPQIAEARLDHLVENAGKRDLLTQLTDREREVLTLVAEGQSNREIADRLEVSVRTIEAQRERLMNRLGVRSVAGLTRFAVANKLVSLEPNRC